VVSAVSDESLYLAKSKERFYDEFNKKITYTCFSALMNTWKTINTKAEKTSLGEITAYLDKTGADTLYYNVVNESEVKYLKTFTQDAKKKTVAENVIQCKIDFDNL
jgi:hypothetical protein